jgi:4-hydroxythreonine-4-phosphate dehydrogenase
MKYKRVAITTGDIDGIGSEVTAKALNRLRPQRRTIFYLWRNPIMSRRELRLIDRYFKRVTVHSWAEALQVPADHKTLVDIESLLHPARWVEHMAKCGLSRSIDALVTAPLSKTQIAHSGLKDNGHTGILKRVTRTKSVHMCFLGKEMNVLLLTGHVSIKKAYEQISQEGLDTAISQANKLLKSLSSRDQKKPIAVVGCNPHAGEDGLIDGKENRIYEKAIKKAKQRRVRVVGPLVPDVCFQDTERKKYSIFVASYHDQGLIPFKMLHGRDTGVQLSLGLPFVRTSVDHGTAKDIFGKNKAESGSMEAALRVALKLINKKNVSW